MELCRCDSARPAPEPQRGSTKIAQGKGAKRLPPWDCHPKNITPLFLFCRPYGRGKTGKGIHRVHAAERPPVLCSRVLCIPFQVRPRCLLLAPLALNFLNSFSFFPPF